MNTESLTDLPLSRRVRHDDPDTSLDAAIRATKASRDAVERVRELMSDGAGRMDQEIRADLRAAYPRSLSTIQHARLALSEAGIIVDSGERRQTEDGCTAIVWRRA